MPNRIEELFAELAESAGGQQQFQIDQQLRQQEAERELYDTDEARTALKIMGGLLTLGIPLPGMRALGLGKLGKPLINKSYGAVGGDMVSQTLKAIEQGTIGRSGSGVGADVVGRVPLPKIKDPVVTKQGPRGPINIGQPPAGPPRPAPPKGTRNTSGISDAERAQLPQTGGGITATKAADKIHAQIAKREKWLKSAKDNYKRSDDAFQEGVRSGSQPDIKAGSKGVEKFGNRIAQLEKEIADLLKSLE
jgi:hypothetical protein